MNTYLIERWLIRHYFWLTTLGIIISFSFLFGLSFEKIQTNYVNMIDDWNEKDKKIKNRNQIIKYGENCLELQEEILKLISRGANAESWIPNKIDSLLKIGNQRYEVLKC